MDNSKKYMKHPDNEKLPHVPNSLNEWLYMCANDNQNNHENNVYYDTDIINVIFNKYFGTDIKKSMLNYAYGEAITRAKNIPESLEFGLEYLCCSNSEDIRKRCRFALYPPKEYKSKIERYYTLYNRKFINDEELGLLCDDLYQQYLKSSK